ncbi:MAG: hypothetical protein ABL908_09240, partial [Hyphomicrobium sp.]
IGEHPVDARSRQRLEWTTGGSTVRGGGVGGVRRQCQTQRDGQQATPAEPPRCLPSPHCLDHRPTLKVRH